MRGGDGGGTGEQETRSIVVPAVSVQRYPRFFFFLSNKQGKTVILVFKHTNGMVDGLITIFGLFGEGCEYKFIINDIGCTTVTTVA